MSVDFEECKNAKDEYYDKAFAAYQKMFPFFPFVGDAESTEPDIHSCYDGLDGFGTSEEFSQYLYQRMMQLAKAASDRPFQVTEEIVAASLMLDLFRCIALTLMDIRCELERGHDNIVRAMGEDV